MVSAGKVAMLFGGYDIIYGYCNPLLEKKRNDFIIHALRQIT